MSNFLDAPIIEPFRRLLRSRRFVTALVAIGVASIVSLVPGLEETQAEMYVVISTISVALIGGYSWEDSARTARERTDLNDLNLRNAIQDAVFVAVNEIEFEDVETEVETDFTAEVTP